MRRWRAALLLVAIAVAAAGAGAALKYARAAAFVTRAAGLGGAAGWLADLPAEPVSTSDVTVPWRGGTLPGRRYDPGATRRPAILLVPGIHAAGIDEPRLAAFALALAEAGHPVLTIGVADLAAYQVRPRAVDMIEDAVGWLAAARGEPVGIIGISFAGSLAIVAAGRTALRDRVAFVTAVGGYGSLRRTLRYLVTGVQPDGTRRPPHDYGLAVVLLNLADRVVPEGQRSALREAILVFLDASHRDTLHDPTAADVFARARQLAAALDEPARGYMEAVNARDVAGLGPRLLPWIAELDLERDLSPETSPPPRAPVFLLHGAADNVIPAIESTLLASALERAGVPVRLLVTPLVTHAEIDRSAAIRDGPALVAFWAAMLTSRQP